MAFNPVRKDLKDADSQDIVFAFHKNVITRPIAKQSRIRKFSLYCTNVFICEDKYPLIGPLANDPPGQIDPVGLWLASMLEDIVANLEEIAAYGSVEQFLLFVEALVLRFAKGNRAQFCEMVGLPPKAICNWYNKGQRPSLPQILRVGYATDSAPSAMLVSRPDRPPILDGIKALHKIPESLWQRGDRPDLSESDKSRIKRRLRDILDNNVQPVPPVQIAKQIGITRSALKYWFPSEFIALSRRFRMQQAQNSVKLVYENARRVLDIVERHKQQGIFPGWKRVDIELRKLGLTLAEPGLLEVYFEAVGLVSRGNIALRAS